ncbi:hypothetical protein TW65_08868 [Stemphylium lycopersici]|uniref:Uncharacterized protein n=1 Tax=Stemphylium lycopersici TaxID=183478 RepID=A0A364MR95_STELY|nr:hypothetical protein TW65_08868 [Stemphylium lycopersici]RAR00002.1 hypothetical protein DDE83_009162 [Stemphylium lycopersici]
MATVRPKRNVLILKGDLSPDLILGLLDTLCLKIKQRKKLKCAPQPWHLFSFICASGRYSRFTWNARNADEAPNDIRTYKQKTSLLSLVEASLHVEVYAPAKHPGAVDVHPMFALHNLFQEAKTRIDLHNDRYVSIRVRPQDSREEISEVKTLKDMIGPHFAVVVDPSEPIHVQLKKNPTLEAAASYLSEWLAEDNQQGNQKFCAAPMGKQEESDDPISVV